MKRAYCNISEETLRWNEACLDYVNPKPICNMSKDTLMWNRACLDYTQLNNERAKRDN